MSNRSSSVQKSEQFKEQTIERQKILDWTCPSEVDYADQQRALRKRRQTGIGEWFLGSDKFKTWIHGNHATLLCSGMPGVGKTMITSFVVSNVLERYKNDTQVGVVYIYCQFSRQEEQTAEYLKSSILRQLLDRLGVIPDRIRSSYDSSRGKDDLTPDEVSDLLDFTLGLFKKSVFIIDAIDELPVSTRDEFLPQILVLQRGFDMNVFATSRHSKMTQKFLYGSWVEIRSREEDLKYSAAVILKKGPLLRERPDLQQRALSKILQVADEILLLAVLYAQYLAGMQQMKQLSGAINGLKSVSDPYSVLYANAMQRLQEDHETGDTKLGLITLFHKTLHEYLVKNQSVWFPQGNDTIGLICVRYLSFDAFADGPSKKPDTRSSHFGCQAPDWAHFAYQSRLMQYPLYEYASKHWHDHIRGSNLETAAIVMAFLAHTNKVSASCQRLGNLTPQTTGTHLATQLLLEKSLKHHLKLCRPKPDVKDNFGRSPLSYAAELNGLVAIDHLIRAGANPSLEDKDVNDRHMQNPVTCTPLSFAAGKGHFLASKALLQRRADVNYRDKYGRSALSYAAKSGSEAVAELLLQSGAHIEPLDLIKRSPLFFAAAADSIGVASLLLERGANVNQADRYNITPLLVAARAGSERMIALLIARGAKVNTESYENDTPLSRAVESQLIESVRLLLRSGADVNRGTNPAHPLTQATVVGSREIVRFLVSAGSDVTQSSRGSPPLAYAAKHGWLDIVQLFLEKGARTDSSIPGSERILAYAVASGSKQLVELLLAHGADINQLSTRTPYCEPLHLALGMISIYGGRRRPGDEPMLGLLLAKGANPNTMIVWESWRENPLDPPLLYALQNLPTEEPSTTRMIKLLLKHGAKTDQVTRQGVSVKACAKRHSKDVQDLLRQYGAQ
ncbi:hypothetical protein KCV07_g2696, partial [Aureobasidium melanogenum]